jgi:enoyl-CoA hydratase
VTRVVPAPDVLDEALALAARIAANGPLAVQLTKELMLEVSGGNDPDERRRMQERVAPVFASEDAREGATAFAEKRAPQWKGR